MSYAPKSYIAFTLMASLVLSTTSATANVLSLADYENFHDFALKKISPIAAELAGLIGNPPMPGGMSRSGLEAAVTTQNCMVRVLGNFDAFRANLHNLGTLVGLASRMVDSEDELLVIGVLRIEAPGYLEGMKSYRQILNANKNRCSQDGATVAKIQEISRVYNDADALVDTIIKKIGAKPN